MSLIQAFVLGVVQGATEFIPVSSSAHLVLVPWLLNWPAPSFAFDVLVQWGTLLAVVVYFWRDLAGIARAAIRDLLKGKPFESAEAKLGWLIVLATIPAVALGLAFNDFFESVFGNTRGIAALLIGTAVILVAAERFGQRTRNMESITWLDALVIGLWQAVSILPGISRSGATIGGGMLRGLKREVAARFSFLMSIPVMLGAGVIALKDLKDAGDLAAQAPTIAVGFIAAAIVGFAVIHWLLQFLGKRSLNIFAAYCLIAGAGCLAVSFIR